MANITFTNARKFPDGTTVGAWKLTDWPMNQRGGRPSAAAEATADSAAGVVAFTGLTAGEQYVFGTTTGDWKRDLGTAPTPAASSGGGATVLTELPATATDGDMVIVLAVGERPSEFVAENIEGFGLAWWCLTLLEDLALDVGLPASETGAAAGSNATVVPRGTPAGALVNFGYELVVDEVTTTNGDVTVKLVGADDDTVIVTDTAPAAGRLLRGDATGQVHVNGDDNTAVVARLFTDAGETGSADVRLRAWPVVVLIPS